MSDILRWRYGDTSPVVIPVESATVIEIGDLVYLDTDDAKPAGAQADAGTEAANQEAFHDFFAGVAMQRSRAGDTAPIRVATRGVFEYPCPSSTFEVGALIGASENGGGQWRELTALRDVPSAAQWTFPPPPRLGHVKEIVFHGDELYVGIEIGASVIVCLLVGHWADGKFGTTPWLTLAGVVLGTLVAMKAVLRTAKAAEEQE